MTFDTEEALLAAMAAELPGLVETYVKPKGESLLQKNIQHYIYEAYTPKVPHTGSLPSRRGSLPGSVFSKIKSTGPYSVDYSVTSSASAAPPAIGWKYRDGGMLAMLEGGDMGFWRKGFPRTSISPTQIQFNKGYLSNAIRKGIKTVFE